MGRLNDRVAIITGAAQGIGAVYAKALADEGAKVVVADLLDGEAVAAEISATGADVLTVNVDVSDEASANAMVRETLDRFGRLDVLVANAAVFGNLSLKPFDEIDVDEWDRVMAVNVRGPFLCAKAAVPAMRENGYGRIINVASGTVFKGTPFFLHYVTSKGAIVAFTRCLAREVGEHGICVNTIAPGLVLSESVRRNEAMLEALSGPVLASRAIKRDQTPEDLIGALLFLASNDSAFMTGQVVVVDGGSAMH